MGLAVDYVFNTYDNTNELLLSDSQGAVDISQATRFVLELDPYEQGQKTTIDSAVDLTAFDWTTNGSNGHLIMKLGHSSIPFGEFDIRLIMYDANFPNGYVWISRVEGKKLSFKVV